MEPAPAPGAAPAFGASLANTPFIECWSEVLAPKWIRFRHLLASNGRLHSDAAYPKLRIARGARVLDVACGFGETTLELAERVGAEGRVLGVDCTREFLVIAERERRAAGVNNAAYLVADIEQAVLPEHSFDVAVSRFGLMYCHSPVRALRVIARALVPGGRVGLITWRALADNPCWSLAEEIALRHLPPPGEQAKVCGPGPFSLADRDTNARIMQAAGFVDVRMQAIVRALCMGRTLDEAVDYQMLIGPAGYVIREAGLAGEAAGPTIRAELRAALRPYQRADGSVWLPSSTWFVSGCTPRA